MKKLISILTATAIVFDLFTPLRLFFDGGKTLTMIIPIVIVVFYDKLFCRKTFWPVMSYMVVCFILMMTGCEYFKIPFLIQILFAYSCLEHFLISRDKSYAKIVLFALYGTLMLMVITSIPLFMKMPYLSRIMNHAEEEGVMEPILYWTIAYPTIHSLPIYAIPLFYFLRLGKTMVKWLAFTAIVAIFVLMLFADATIPLILNLFLYVVLFLYNPRLKTKTNLGRFFILGIVMLFSVNKTVIFGLLKAVQYVFVGSSTYKKIDEMICAMSGQGTSGDLEGREEHFKESVDAFSANPFFPEMDVMKIGRHNVFLDQIVALGLILSITFIWFLVERIRRPLKYLSDETLPYYLVGVMGFVIMGLLKNYLLVSPTLCFIPMTLMLVPVKKTNWF